MNIHQFKDCWSFYLLIFRSLTLLSHLDVVTNFEFGTSFVPLALHVIM